jgi:hypothetical protein
MTIKYIEKKYKGRLYVVKSEIRRGRDMVNHYEEGDGYKDPERT